jgi:hypothetical protein
VAWTQGDQIGQIFAYWAIVYFGQFFENDIISPNFWATLFNGKSYVVIFTKNSLGYIFGRFFTSSSGHSALDRFFVQLLLPIVLSHDLENTSCKYLET